jgi:hypothetical protein
METCSGGRGYFHDEVVYQCKNCPVCYLMREKEEADSDYSKLEDDCIKAETERDEVKAREQQLENIIADCPGCSARKIAEQL